MRIGIGIRFGIGSRISVSIEHQDQHRTSGSASSIRTNDEPASYATAWLAEKRMKNQRKTSSKSYCANNSKNRLLISLGLAAALLLVSGRTLAHHGSGVSYDTGKMLTMEGTVTEFQWRNPHVYILYDVKDADGNIVNWGAETHSPVVCEDQDGWSKSTLKPGDKITISVFLSKISTPRGLLAKIVLNGQVLIDDTRRGKQAGQ